MNNLVEFLGEESFIEFMLEWGREKEDCYWGRDIDENELMLIEESMRE